MKTVYLVRHAKSSRKYTSLDDFERPLNKRGRRSITLMGEVLNNLDVTPDSIISSPANRAAMTARGIAAAINYPPEKIEYKETIYLSDKDTLIELIKGIKNSVKRAMLVGHNPGITDLANYLCDKGVDNIPTCGILCMDFSIRSWRDVSDNSGSISFFEFPKNHSR